MVALGEVMARLETPGCGRFQQALPGVMDVTFAGAEASVAASIAYLGGDAAFVSALPEHAIADACVADLRSLGVDTRHILRTGHGRLGLYFFENGANQRPANVIYDREGSSMALLPPEAYDWEAIFAGASWFFLSGITPAISRNAAEVARVAVEEASVRGVRVAFDVNFRSKLWRWESGVEPRELAARTVRGLLPQVDLFIGGREDAGALLGIHACDAGGDPCLDVARQVVAEFPRMKQVAMTLRESISASHNDWGGMLYDAALDQAFYAPLKDGGFAPYPITNIVDRLGGGDAFSAGLLFALGDSELSSPRQAVAFAVAASCLSHSIQGDVNYSSRAEIEALMGGATAGRVVR